MERSKREFERVASSQSQGTVFKIENFLIPTSNPMLAVGCNGRSHGPLGAYADAPGPARRVDHVPTATRTA